MVTTAVGGSGVEVGACHDGFCDSLVTNLTRALCGVGGRGPTHKVGTLFGFADGLHSRGIMKVLHERLFDYMECQSF